MKLFKGYFSRVAIIGLFWVVCTLHQAAKDAAEAARLAAARAAREEAAAKLEKSKSADEIQKEKEKLEQLKADIKKLLEASKEYKQNQIKKQQDEEAAGYTPEELEETELSSSQSFTRIINSHGCGHCSSSSNSSPWSSCSRKSPSCSTISSRSCCSKISCSDSKGRRSGGGGDNSNSSIIGSGTAVLQPATPSNRPHTIGCPAEMGATVSSSREVQYSVCVPSAEPKADRTPPRRHYSALSRLADNFSTNPVKNAWELFQMGVAKSAEGPCLGTRVVSPDGRKGDYVWKTYREVERLALEAGSGLLNGDFVPVRHFEQPDGKQLTLRCIGIFARNREEWIITEHASNAYGVTVVPLYDTLGPHSTRFILGETQMKTVVSDGECLVKLFDALQQQQRGKDQQQEQQQQREGQHEDQHEEQQHDIVLECVITLDKVSDEQKEKAEALKIRLLSWEDLLELVG